MEPNQTQTQSLAPTPAQPQVQNTVHSKTSAKDFFINLGAIISLGMIVINLINLLFTTIDKVYPPTTNFYYNESYISWPVASLIIFFPVYVLLMWLLEKSYITEPEKRNLGVRKWLTYATLFLAGLTIAIDLVTLLYCFIDGQELTAGFLLKVLIVLVVAVSVFFYYISDIVNRLNIKSRKIWAEVSLAVVFCSIVLGFSVLGSPATQRMLKYDQQKVGDLQNINSQVINYYSNKGTLPKTLDEIGNTGYYISEVDAQSGKTYEYQKTSNTTYNLCADFNKTSDDKNVTTSHINPYDGDTWVHGAGHYCFSQTINQNLYSKPVPVR